MVQYGKNRIGKDDKIVEKKKPLFNKILAPMMVLLVLEIALLAGSVFGQGVLSELNENEQDIINEKISGRKNYLENEMVNNWMNLQYTAETINAKTEQLAADGKINIESLDNGSLESDPLISEVAENLIDMMRTNRVTGAYIVLNNEDLEASSKIGQYKNKPGIYLRDVNPVSQASYRNQDLLIERGSVNLVHELGIATDTSWTTQFEFGDSTQPYYDFLYQPFQKAYENKGKYRMTDLGYWSGIYELFRENRPVISYTMPLILEDGTVYGVLGIDITLDYMRTLLPYNELEKNARESSAYKLAIKHGEDRQEEEILINGPLVEEKADDNGYFSDNKYYIHEENLNIYSRNAPFSDEQWVISGIVPVKDITSFTRKVQTTLIIAIILTIVIGVIGSFVISYSLTKPVARLSKEIAGKDPGKRITLNPTGIMEIDQMADSIEKLSSDVIESGRRFTRIIKMASVRLAGFQIDSKEQKLFSTDHFFEIFGRPDLDEEDMTVQEFTDAVKSFDKYYIEKDEATGGYIYKIADGRRYCFLRLRFRDDGRNCFGLVEDVTQSLREKNILKHERDHDPLTNLYNRRAFRRLIQELFDEKRKDIKTGALLMLDLDNLKYINDTYGHDYGDRYIARAAQVMTGYLPPNALTARISGDEFNIFFFGYESKKEIWNEIASMKKEFDNSTIELPGGRQQRIRLSGGVAWYPLDSDSYETLFHYADYAMYTVKNSVKGEICEFNKEKYKNDRAFLENSAALIKLIDNKAVRYAFQPIVDAHTGRIFAYEALMRPAVSEFKTVFEILEVGRREGKLNQVEEISWFLSLEAFKKQAEAGTIEKDVLLFINSIPNQKMTDEKEELFARTYKDYLQRLVMELTEEEQMPKEVWEGKHKKLKEWKCRIALDDYGSGYNSENILIHVSPDFIKVDIAIVRDIHRNVDKQEVVEYIVNYAHQRGKYIIAEGVESKEETEEVIRLGVDYLQGYFIARPDFTAPTVNEEALEVMKNMNREER